MERLESIGRIVEAMGLDEFLVELVDRKTHMEALQEEFPEQYNKISDILREIVRNALVDVLDDVLIDEDLPLLEKMHEIGTVKRQDIAIELLSKRWKPEDILQEALKHDEMPDEARGVIILHSLADAARKGPEGFLERIADMPMEEGQKHHLCNKCGDCEDPEAEEQDSPAWKAMEEGAKSLQEEDESEEESESEEEDKKGPDGRLLN